MKRELDELFNDALDLPAEQRATFLDEMCGEDRSLRAELESLLAHVANRPEVVAVPDPQGPGDRARSTPGPMTNTSDTTVPSRIGRYPIVGEIGRGGMGVVYRAQDPDLRREIALKVLFDSAAIDPERLREEARLAASLSHSSIATVHSLEEDSGLWFFTMELAEGENLAVELDRGALDLDRVLRIGVQVAAALECAHAASVVHRDLKPANVVVSDQGQAKVLDFGIAKLTEETVADENRMKRAGSTVRGTPDYMSPEQVLGLLVDYRSDIWSFGALLFECLTAQKAADALADVDGDPQRLASMLPTEIAETICACLNPAAEDRPAKIADVGSVLEQRLAPPARRWNRWMTMAVAGVLLAVGIAAFSILAWLRPGEMSVLRITEDGSLSASDAAGKQVWTRRMEDPIVQNIRYTGVDNDVVLRPFEIYHEAGRPVGALVATASPSDLHELWFLDAQSGDPIWKREGAWIAPGGKSEIPPVYRWQRLVAWPGPDTVIVSKLGGGNWYPAAIEFLTAENRLLGHYYHPGYLYFHDQIDLDGDGVASLLLFGDNSSARLIRDIVPFEGDAHCGAVVALRPPAPFGEGFPYSHPGTGGRDWPEMEKAQEEVYLLFPPMTGSVWADVGSMAGFGNPKQFEVGCKDGRLYTLDASLRPIGCHLSARSRADSLHNKVGIPVPPVIRVEGGGEWEVIEVPTG